MAPRHEPRRLKTTSDRPKLVRAPLAPALIVSTLARGPKSEPLRPAEEWLDARDADGNGGDKGLTRGPACGDGEGGDGLQGVVRPEDGGYDDEDTGAEEHREECSSPHGDLCFENDGHRNGDDAQVGTGIEEADQVIVQVS